MTKRLLLSYLSITALVLLLLEVPLGLIYGRRERDTLSAAARRDATGLAVLAAESLERPASHDLAALAASYRSQTGTEVAVYDASGQTVVGFDFDEPPGGEPDVAPLVARALGGGTSTVRRLDEHQAQLMAALPVQSGTRIIGAVVVAVPAGSTDSRILRAWVALAALAVGLLSVAAAVGLLLARSLAAPLVTLQQAAKRFGQGDLDARAPPGGPIEIAAVTDEFNAMAARIGQLVGSQRRFVADASHQLRTPLTALRLRLENLAADAPEETTKELEAAEAEGQRLARLVDGLLTLSRAEDHRSDRQVIDVVAIGEDRRDAWAPLAEEQEVKVAVEVSGPVQARAVPGDLEQILDNLLSNALEASPPASVVVIRIEPAHRDGLVAIHVLDEGPGMTSAEREHAFDRFWQGHDRVGGSGLGLAIVQQLAEANGGQVELGVNAGGGLDAVVRLIQA